MTSRRSNPFIWASWLPKLLVGESTCEWAVWFQVHNEGFKKVESDLMQWHLDHTDLLSRTRANLQADGLSVLSEGENTFVLTGRSGARIKGKPDLIVLGERPVICDIKTGKPRHSHRAQVLLYMYAVPRADDRRYRGMVFDGLIVYGDKIEEVPAYELEAFKPKLQALLERLLSGAPAAKVPTWEECRFCKLTKADCHDRVEAPQVDEVVFVAIENF